MALREVGIDPLVLDDVAIAKNRARLAWRASARANGHCAIRHALLLLEQAVDAISEVDEVGELPLGERGVAALGAAALARSRRTG